MRPARLSQIVTHSSKPGDSSTSHTGTTGVAGTPLRWCHMQTNVDVYKMTCTTVEYDIGFPSNI
eukprot:6479054-Amphidinium_carterae.4